MSDTIEKITVLCVRIGPRYGREYVERLRNMVSRHMSVPYDFYCITDDQKQIDGVNSIHLPMQPYKKAWWHKIHMFDSSLPIKGRVLYFDLDVIIFDNIDKLVVNQDNKFLGIQDFNRKFHNNWMYLNSSAMTWIHGEHTYIYDKFMASSHEAQKLHGDQDWIWKIAKQNITFWPREWIQSYKWEIRSREELINRTGKQGFKIAKNPSIPNGCSVAVFHGDPKMEEVKDPFVVDNWR